MRVNPLCPKLLATLARDCRLSLSRRTLGSVGVTSGRHASGEWRWAKHGSSTRCTPRGKGRKDVGALVQTHPQELMATTLRALAARNALDPHDVDDVVVGCVSQAGDQGACIARNAVLLAQWPQVTGVSLNRFCGSGLQGVNFALMGVMSGQQQLVVGGGVESMSRQPIGSDGAGLDGNNPDLRELHPIVPQGISADLIATLEVLHASTWTPSPPRARPRPLQRSSTGGSPRASSLYKTKRGRLSWITMNTAPRNDGGPWPR